MYKPGAANRVGEGYLFLLRGTGINGADQQIREAEKKPEEGGEVRGQKKGKKWE